MAESGRVLIADMPRLLRDIVVGSIRLHPGTSLVGVLDDDADLERAVEEAEPQVLVVGTEGGELPARSREILEARARLIVLCIDVSDGNAYLHRLTPERVALGPVSPDELVLAVAALAGARD